MKTKTVNFTLNGRAFSIPGSEQSASEVMFGMIKQEWEQTGVPPVVNGRRVGDDEEQPLLAPDYSGQADITPDPAFGAGIDEEPLTMPWESTARHDEDDDTPLTPQFVVSDADVSDDDGPLVAPGVFS